MLFRSALQIEGGVEAINRAFEKPPTSTEQILHPEKFTGTRDEPKAVTLPVLSSAEWRLIGSNVLGEFGIRALLTTQLGFAEAQSAAAGWGGDRYQVYERGAGGPLGLVWESVWDDEHEAEEFADAYRRFAEKRGVPARVTQSGAKVRVIQSDATGFLDLVKE